MRVDCATDRLILYFVAIAGTATFTLSKRFEHVTFRPWCFLAFAQFSENHLAHGVGERHVMSAEVGVGGCHLCSVIHDRGIACVRMRM